MSLAPIAEEVTEMQKPRRLEFLDVLRGMTVALMILVNNNGDEASAYWPLKHAEWNGWTPTDLVFPTFLFLVGITIVLSTASRVARGESKKLLLKHALRRAAILFALGILIHGLPAYHLATLRIYGVLQRIAICYLVCTLLYLWNRSVGMLAGVAIFCLFSYWILMRWVPIPGFGLPGRDFPFMDKEINWVSVVDRRLFPGRLLEGTRDPLGLLSTIPAIATCLLGMLCGIWIRSARSMREKAFGMLAGAVAGLVLGQIWAQWFPINKRLWTSSYVLFSAGWTLLLLATCYSLIEMGRRNGRWTLAWKVFGSNAIFVYAFSELLSLAMERIPVASNGHTQELRRFLYDRFLRSMVSPAFGSLLYSVLFLLVCFLPCLFLYRKKLFLKL